MFGKRPVEKIVPEMSYIMYASFIYPAAFVVVGGTYYNKLCFWGLTKAHAARRAQNYVQKNTGHTIDIYKSIKHYNEMLRLRKELKAQREIKSN